MEAVIQQNTEQNQKKGRTAATIYTVIMIIVMLIPIFFYQNPPPGQEGILVNLGLPDIGDGDDNAGPSAQVIDEPTPPSEPETQPQPSEPVTEPTPEPERSEPPKPAEKQVVTTEDPAAIALRKQKEKEARERADREARERQEQREREAQEARERAEREARERAERERQQREAAASDLKNELGGLFGSGGGKGNTGSSGNQGDPNGDPSSDRLEGISTGSGKVGGGLGGRGLVSSPSVTENSQKSGTVVVELCVDANGSIIPSSVRQTQRGSTTTDSQLVNAAIQNAKRWRFSEGTIDKQCGTITYNFKVR